MTHYLNELTEALGDAVSADPEILRSYDHDLGEMPGALMRMINNVPDVVVAARTAADVAKALSIANQHGLPVTPRAQATSGYGGAIPCRGGMILDVSGLNRVISVNAKAASVDVEPGVVWGQLSQALARHGLDNRITPTSGPSSTVGGWFAMGGVGIGSIRYGDIGGIVEEVDVAGVDGEINTYGDDDLELFHQTCGILGIVTRLRLKCRPTREITPLAAWLPDADAVSGILPALESNDEVYSVTVQSAEYAAIRARAEGHHAPIETGFLLSIAANGRNGLAAAKNLVALTGGELLDEALAQQEWNGRYYPMRIKRVGPSTAVGEFYIPSERFGSWWREACKALPKDRLALEGIAAAGKRIAILVSLLDDARSLLYPLRMSKAMIPLRSALRNAGSIYAPGMWFARHSRAFFGAARYERIQSVKQVLDPRGILNPGKINGPKVPFLPGADLSSLIYHGSNLIGPLAARLTYKGRGACGLPNGEAR